MIQVTCPQCGKALSMTLEELSTHGGRVVCPQCLGEFVPSGIELPASEPARVDGAAPPVLFCHSCGEHLPAADLRFCPYCGVELFSNAPTVAEVVAEVAPATVAVETQSIDMMVEPAAPSHKKPRKIAGMPMIGTITRPPSREEVMGSPLLRFVCFVAIAVLLGIFLWLVWLISMQAAF